MSADIILVVCTANICRSPFAELLLKAGLHADLNAVVESAGTHAHEGMVVCARVEEHLTTDEWVAQARGKVSRAVTPELLESAALILTASREQQSELVRLNPSVRDRTHTLREAAHRGSQFRPGPKRESRGRVREYAAHLDRARLTAEPLSMPRHAWAPWARPADPASIGDGHNGGTRGHVRTLQEVVTATETIVAQLNRGPIS